MEKTSPYNTGPSRGDTRSSQRLKRQRVGPSEGVKRQRTDDGAGPSEGKEQPKLDKEQLRKSIENIGAKNVSEIFARAIEDLKKQRQHYQEQLESSSTQKATKSYSAKIHAYSLTIEKIEAIEKQYFKEGKIEEGRQEILGIIKKKDLASVKATEAIQKAINEALENLQQGERATTSQGSRRSMGSHQEAHGPDATTSADVPEPLSTEIWTWSGKLEGRKYDAAFAAIVKGTLEKTQSQMVVGELLSGLKAQNAFGKSEVKILDIGSDDGGTLHKILSNSGNLGGVSLYGIDYREGPAEKFRTKLREFGSEGITVSSVTAVDGPEKGNAYSGNISASLGISHRDINVALVSHLAYGVTPEEIEKLVTDISSNLLSSDGIGIFLHVKDAKNSTLLDLRNRYGERAEADIQASEQKVTEPSQEIAKIAQETRCRVTEITYETKTYFDKISDKEWETIKNLDPHNINQLQNEANQKLIDNILRISFFALRTPQDLMQNKTWSALVNDVKQIVTSNGGYIKDTVSMQILQPPHASFTGTVEDAAQQVSKNIQDIAVRAEQAFFSSQKK